MFALAGSHAYGASLAFAFLLGVEEGAINTVNFAAMRAIVPDQVLGRVPSVDQVGSFTSTPPVVLLGGLIASRDGIGFDYTVAELGLLVNGPAMVALKDLRGLRYRG
jgi:hypothetical protein